MSSMKKILVLLFCLSATMILLRAEEMQGIIIHNQAKVDDCYRLISSRYLNSAHLLRPDGRVVHSWFYAPTEEATSDFSGFGMTWHYAEMLPNGNLLVIIKDEMILELDWFSNLVWKATLRAHHDAARTANGHTLVLSRRDVDNPWHPGQQIAMDEVIEFSETGEQVWTWQFKDHLQDLEKFVEQPLPPAAEFRDWPHINTCEVLPDNPIADKDARFRAGNVLMCGRHANTIFIVERQSGDIVWARGPDELQGPHHPTMTANGNILVYDNGRHTSKTSRGYTRILEIEPLTGVIVWSYAADPKTSFYSPSRGSNNRLRNGNTLIAESDRGHLLEVTAKGEIVWEYWNSDRTDQGERMPLYRTIPYDKADVETLLAQFGVVQDVLPEHEEKLTFEPLGPEHQYKRYIREVVFYAELGYFDHALNFLDLFMQTFPNDPEGYYGYAAVYAAKKNPEQAFVYMTKAIETGLPLSRFTCGLTDMLTPLLSSEKFKRYVEKQDAALVHGPLLGDVTNHSAKFWLRTRQEANVQIQAKNTDELDFKIRSSIKRTAAENENTAIVLLDDLKPRTTYDYRLVIDDIVQDKIYKFTTFPEKGHSVVFSTGFGGGAGATPKHEYMWDTIASHHLPFFLLLGDNVYIDHPERPAVQQFCYYRRQSRPEFRRLTSSTAVYAIWDDHDFTFNDGKGSPSVEKPAWKRDVWRLFTHQWNNPFYGGGESQPGCWFDFSYGDVDFFMLDCRYYREQPEGNPGASMLGVVQKQRLLDKLKASTATFKVVASSVPWAHGTKPGSLDTWDGHPEEREDIFSFIEKNKISGVLLLSADRHRSDAWKIRRPNGYDFYEFESSKLTNMHTHAIMPGAIFSYNKKCSFGQLDFNTTVEDPIVTFRIFSIENEEIHRLTVYKSQLSFER